eukprot:tig00021168_g19111.t1
MGVTIVSEMWAEDDRADFSSDPSFDIDLSVLRRRAAEIQEKEANGEELDSYPKEEEEEDPLLGLSKVFVLLVHSGTDNEGIYSLKMGEHDIILAFEAEEEALRYATLLEAQDFPTPNVEAFAPEEIRDFCEESGHRMGVVPPGSLFMPPEESAIDPAWKTGRAPEEGDKRRSERAAAQQAELDDARLRLEKLLGFGDGEGSTPRPPLPEPAPRPHFVFASVSQCVQFQRRARQGAVTQSVS